MQDLFDGDRVTLESFSDDFRKLVVRVDGPHHGYAYFVVNASTLALIPVGPAYANVTKTYETRRIDYKAADGMEIPAYLTLPAAPAAGKLPLVVLVHGGPAARDRAECDWWTQALAEQGYAVLRPNYRGSDLGFEFLSAGFGQWGRKMQSDVSDGARYLAAQGRIDPQRVCIVGASYGGYAALAGVTLESGVYRCAVSVAGIADLRRMLRSEGRGAGQRYWDRYMGVGGPDDPMLDTLSPARHVDRVSVPVLLIHGKDDTVVAYEQSELMRDALRKAGKPVEFVTLKVEDHWLSRSATRLQMLEATVAFLRTHNPPTL